jgi:hypothetical protein
MIGKLKWGAKVRTDISPWVSFGVHLDFVHLHLDIHFLWWVIVLGNVIDPVYCGMCGRELPDEYAPCPVCDKKLCPICGKPEVEHEIVYECP